MNLWSVSIVPSVILLELEVGQTMMPSIYTAEDFIFSPDLLGGKAANLAWMTREGFPVTLVGGNNRRV